MKNERKIYLQKNNAPIVGVDTFETQPQNYYKPGVGKSIAHRQYHNSRILKENGIGYGNGWFNVLCVGINLKSDCYDIEDRLLDIQAPCRVRPQNHLGGNTREFAKDVPLWGGIESFCTIAHGTFNEIDNVDDFKRLEPTVKGLNHALKNINYFDHAVVSQGFNRMQYGYHNGGVWYDEVFINEKKPQYTNNSEAAHLYATVFDGNNPFSFSFLKLKKILISFLELIKN